MEEALAVVYLSTEASLQASILDYISDHMHGIQARGAEPRVYDAFRVSTEQSS